MRRTPLIILPANYTSADHVKGKAANKHSFQTRMGLSPDPSAPILFWPSRLDPYQKGCQLLTEILYQVVKDYRALKLQIAIVADGDFQKHFHEIVHLHQLDGRVAVHGFSEELSRIGYAASDFMLMPSRFEPCGLPQMVCGIYGSLPIVHNTGGLHDTVQHLDLTNRSGNGFVFDYHDSKGLRWAIDEAMAFYQVKSELRANAVKRVMQEHEKKFTHAAVAESYIELYERLLGHSLKG